MRVIPAAPRASGSGWRSGSWKRSAEAALAALLLIVAAGCSGKDAKAEAAKATAPARPSPGVIESPSMEYLPRGAAAAGWRLMGDPLVYPRDQIRTYMGLEAQHYLDYDVLDLTVGEYDRPDGSMRATVEIYRFADYVKAFGAYSTRPVPGAPLGLENASIVSRNSIFAWSGPFVVRLVSLTGPADAEPLRALSAAVLQKMPKAPGRPAVFQFFPEENRLPGSEKFVAGPVFGQPYLARGFVAEYQVGPDRIEGMILPAPSKEIATEILNRYKFLFATNGRLLDPVPNLGEDNFVGEDRFLGRTAAYRIDRFVVAFRGFGDKQLLIERAIASNQRILNSIRRQLQEAEKAAAMTTGTAPRARGPEGEDSSGQPAPATTTGSPDAAQPLVPPPTTTQGEPPTETAPPPPPPG